jgi:hypothetical protein
MTISVGSAAMRYLPRKAAFFESSVLMLSQTNRPAYRSRDLSG